MAGIMYPSFELTCFILSEKHFSKRHVYAEAPYLRELDRDAQLFVEEQL